MRTMHLFAGAGGGMLADLILGHEPIVAVEHDRYCCAVLRERAEQGWFPDLHVHEGDIRLFDPSPWKGRVDCIHAGFPCQDISATGKGAGIAGERSWLFSEVLRAIDVIRPGYVFLENSPLIVSRGLDHVLRSLAERGYDAVWTILAAADVGAPHLRKRWWCLAWSADADCSRLSGFRGPGEVDTERIEGACRNQSNGFCAGADAKGDGWREERAEQLREQGRFGTSGVRGEIPDDSGARCIEGKPGQGGSVWDEARGKEPERPRSEMAHSNPIGRNGRSGRNQTGGGEPSNIRGDSNSAGLEEREGEPGNDGEEQPPVVGADWWSVEPDVGRVAHGVAARVDRIRAIGNGQVPLCAAAAWKILWEEMKSATAER